MTNKEIEWEEMDDYEVGPTEDEVEPVTPEDSIADDLKDDYIPVDEFFNKTFNRRG